MNDTTKPTAQTHIPEQATIPIGEAEWAGEGRPVLDAPTLWRSGVKVVHKLTGREAVIFRMDLGTMMFRAYYPDTNTLDGRTDWQQAREWNVKVTLHPDELARRAAATALQDAINALDPKEVGWATVLLDGDDPVKGLAKLQAMREAGIIKSAPEVLAAAAGPTEAESLAKAAQLDAAQRRVPRKTKPEGAP